LRCASPSVNGKSERDLSLPDFCCGAGGYSRELTLQSAFSRRLVSDSAENLRAKDPRAARRFITQLNVSISFCKSQASAPVLFQMRVEQSTDAFVFVEP
jgi:Fe-S oxidoreductase